MNLYLDNAATTLQKPPSVAEAMARAVRRLSSPGRGGYRQAMEAAETVYRCRRLAAELFDVDHPERVVFTSSATHGLNIAIKSLVKPGDQVVISGYEHNAVARPLTALGAEIVIAESSLFDADDALEAFEREINENTRAVICTQVSNVFGCPLPVEDIAALCRSKNIPLIIDASQAAGALEVSLKKTGATFIAMPGHKGLYGPQGTGLLLCGAGACTLMEGGTGSESRSLAMPDFLPDRLEPGTHNVPGIAGLEQGLLFLRQRGQGDIHEDECRGIQWIAENLAENRRIRLFTDAHGATGTGVMSFAVEGQDCEAVAARLGEAGVAVRAGLHCAPVAHGTAGTLDTGTVRISLSAFTSPGQCKAFVRVMNRLYPAK